MKTIASLTGAEFLKACGNVKASAYDFFTKTRVLEIRKTMPTFDGSETEAEKAMKFNAQGKKNISAMLDRMLVEYPEETYSFLKSLCVEETDEELTGYEIVEVASEILESKKVLDFFLLLARLA